MNPNTLPPDIASGLRRADAAQAAPYGSIARRFDPNAYGSIENRWHPDVFGPYGAANPDYQQSLKRYMAPRAPYSPYAAQFQQPTLRRGTPMSPMMSSMLMQEMYGGGSPAEAQQNDGDDDGR